MLTHPGIPLRGFRSLPWLLLLLAALTGTSLGNETKRFARQIDPIVLPGERLPSCLGLPIQSLRLAAVQSGRLLPIPFQIDEKDPDGIYVFRSSDPNAADVDHGLLDTNDELAFMARDLGARIDAEMDPGLRLLAEITVVDPVDGSRGWCYLATSEDFPEFSSVDYVSYDTRDDRVLTRNYRIGFSPQAPISYGDTTVTTEGGGNNQRLNERVITRLKATFLGIFKLVRSEKDFRSVRKGYIDGQVRIIKRVGNSMRQVFGKYGPEVVVDYTFYFSNWIMPTIIDLPVDVGKFVHTLSLRGGTDWTPESEGMVFYTKYIPPGTAVIDGHMSEAEKNMDLRLDIDHIWHLYTGALNGTGQGSVLFRILMDDKLTKALTAETYYYDKFHDPDYEPDPFSRDEYRSYFEGSYIWKGMEKLPKGRYYLTSWATIMPDYLQPGDEQKYLDILDKPLQTSVDSPSRTPESAVAAPPAP